MKKIILRALFGVLIMAGFFSCSKDEHHDSQSGKTYVIVPGAWQAPYAWATVKAELEQAGNKVVVVELQAHGKDTTADAHTSINLYRDRVVTAVNGLSGKVILVGHSLGGEVISAVAEAIPGKIDRLVYLAAFLPASGQSVYDLASTDTTSLLRISIIQSGYVLDLIHDNIANIFIQDGTTDEKNLVLSNYRFEPGLPFNDKVTLSATNYGTVKKYYIHTLLDQAVTYKLQKRMVAGAGIIQEYNLNTSHSPFLSKPDSVTILLTKIAAQ
ncbi:Alpha/beta hydrolase family protein [Pedobacter westerhofensis]|uniref:Alpha/beta hydrolase family protein n=1 Tax=Pedobacter westerhofensis TaxID=425512 RepID=A0A521FM37_9SPHI|nr:alpha/beta fold hydrolase [Pedobacter westerhofensis]SMO97267.1 Alpha/beta hydrolase family protein [Pedobacter westerhofensis]